VETEKQLLQEIADGDRRAMRRLYDRFSGYASAVCLRYVADRDAARDVLQDSFVKILTSIKSFDYRGEGSLKAWVARIVANESLNYLRRNGRMVFIADVPDEPEAEEPDVGGVPMDVLTGMIRNLSPGYRAVFNMYVFGNMSHKEIARTLNIKESSSASQYLRAKKILARNIRQYLKTGYYETGGLGIKNT